MNFRRFLIALLAVSALLLSTGSLYSSSVFAANHEQEAQAEKPAEYYYICPMHSDVKAKKPGKCPKCKMKLEKKRIKPPDEAKPSDQ